MKHAHQIYNDNIQDSSIIQHDPKETIRLNKYISSSGYCSRREADRLIEEGKVRIDGIVAEIGTRVLDTQEVEVENFKIEAKQKFVYIALNKPIGITCTTDLKDKDNIVEYLNLNERIFPIGRLDKDSSGLILMSNDGDIVNKILRSTNQHEKEYVVTLDNHISDEVIEQMQAGVKIYNPVSNEYQISKPCTITKVDSRTFHIILIEGLNRQIRRMCTAFGYHVEKLTRIRVMNIELGNMEVGTWRYISNEELTILNSSIQADK